jgi:hypothetical protein
LQDKERFNEIAEELTKLSTKFSNNVLDATKSYTKLLTTETEVAGLPASARALLAQQASSKGHEGATAETGPWLVTLDIPAYLPIQVGRRAGTLHLPLSLSWCTLRRSSMHILLQMRQPCEYPAAASRWRAWCPYSQLTVASHVQGLCRYTVKTELCERRCIAHSSHAQAQVTATTQM